MWGRCQGPLSHGAGGWGPPGAVRGGGSPHTGGFVPHDAPKKCLGVSKCTLAKREISISGPDPKGAISAFLVPETPRIQVPPPPRGPGGTPAPPRRGWGWGTAAPLVPHRSRISPSRRLILRQITEISRVFFAIPPAIHSNLDRRPAGP